MYVSTRLTDIELKVIIVGWGEWGEGGSNQLSHLLCASGKSGGNQAKDKRSDLGLVFSYTYHKLEGIDYAKRGPQSSLDYASCSRAEALLLG